MRNVKHINEFLIKIYESATVPLFEDESNLKNLLMKDSSFAKGAVHQALINIAHDEWGKHTDWSYDSVLKWLAKFGNLPFFAMLLGKYNYQVCNGGHSQYYDNGYASSKSHGFGGTYDNIDNHEELLNLFRDLDMDRILSHGSVVFDIMNGFNLELEDELIKCDYCGGHGQSDCEVCGGHGSVDCKECDGTGDGESGGSCPDCDGDGSVECENCYGDGSVECEECQGNGEYESGEKEPDRRHWDLLDTRYYDVYEEFMEEFNNYLKTINLDDEKMSDLIELAKETQKYNL